MADDISHHLIFKKTSGLDYDEWMEKYIELEEKERLYSKKSNKAEHRQGIINYDIRGVE